jgi:integrase
MYSEPTIHIPKGGGRSYLEVYIDGERHRLYNGKSLGIKCNPNRTNTIAQRDKALSFLQFHLLKQLGQGWKPRKEETLKPKEIVVVPAIKAFTDLKEIVEAEHLSDVYEHDLLAMIRHFLAYLKANRLENFGVADINSDQVETFLQQFKSSATNYMNRRRALSALFLRLKTQKLLKINPTQETGKLKEVPHLNLPYKKEQLRKVLEIVKDRHKELYLCCLLMYGCLLRPHQEIRLLKRGYFDEGFNKISLGGNQNKSRRIRSVLVPEYVRTEIIHLGIPLLEDGMNIFSRTISSFNLSYFNTAWSRIKKDLLEQGLIEQDHTLYSFRHSAAVYMYLKTKDPYKIQQAFGHSSLRVTLIYLRSLGLIIDASLDDLPELPI